MRLLIPFALIAFQLFNTGCATDSAPERAAMPVTAVPGQELAPSEESPYKGVGAYASKTHRGVTYTFRLLSATEFLSRKGETVLPEDREQLDKESVLILTFNAADKTKDIFESGGMTLEREAATQYLIGALADDVTLEQAGGEPVAPSGVQYEKSPGEMGRLHAFLYFSDIAVTDETNIMYYDRLFGAGLLRFTLNK